MLLAKVMQQNHLRLCLIGGAAALTIASGGLAGLLALSTAPSKFISIELGKSAAMLEAMRSTADLHAQQLMAVWAGAMFYATLIQMVIGALGAYFVWRAFQESRRAGDAGQASAQAARDAVDQAERQHEHNLAATKQVYALTLR